MKNYFQEKQSFTQWWLWALLLGISTVLSFRLIQDLFFEPKQPEEALSIGLSLILLLASMLFFRFSSLRTRITEQAIEINYTPFFHKQYNWKEIDKAEVVNYGFVGGWGFRYSFRYGWTYNVKGSKGLALVFKDGRKRLIGTQRPEELREALNALPAALLE